MMISSANLTRQLEELQLIRCSLLPGELFSFLLPHEDEAVWSRLLETLPSPVAGAELAEVRFRVTAAQHVRVWFEIELPRSYPGIDLETQARIAVKGVDIRRDEQERWQTVIKEKLAEVEGSEYPIYQLISLHLLPMLHSDSITSLGSSSSSVQAEVGGSVSSAPSPLYHALLTSHHLVSPTKRRSLHQWSSSLSLAGFAKVGHPGVIYASGAREGIEEFVANVKGMQWLALRVRFVEPVEVEPERDGDRGVESVWKEFQKVGEVVEEMRRIGREEYVVEMGIGSAGTSK